MSDATILRLSDTFVNTAQVTRVVYRKNIVGGSDVELLHIIFTDGSYIQRVKGLGTDYDTVTDWYEKRAG